MKKGARNAIVVVLVLVALVAGGALFLATRLDGIVASLIARHGSAATQTTVTVDGTSIDLREASGSISGLTIGNPEGFGSEPAIALGNFSIRIDAGTVTSDTVVLNDVTVAGARLNVIQRGAGNNLRTLLDNLTAGAPAESPDDGGAAKKIIIERFALEDARASVSIPDVDETREVTLPTIVLEDIGRATNGATAAQAARQILTPVIRRALQSTAAETLKDKAREKLGETKDEVLDGVLDRIGGEDDEDGDND